MADRKTIGLFVGNSHTDHPRKIIEGFYSASVDTGCDVHFYLGTESSAFSRGSAQLENDFDYQYISLYDYRKFDRLSANCIALGSLMTQQESSKKEGFVNGFKGEKNLILEDTIALPDSTYMIADNYQGMFACVNHLIEVHGKKKIIYLSGPVGNRDSEEREQAYRDCMKAHGLTVTEKMVTHGDYSEYVDDVVNGLLDANPDADAIASANDEMCQSVYRVLTERRMRVGKDIAVTGFDNVPEAASMTPSLTTVRQRSFELGYRAAGAAFRLAEGEIPKPERVPADFICRKSCGCEEEAPVKPDTENRSLADSVESMRLLLHKALMGPFLIRELNRISADSTLFFYKVGTTMRDLGAKSSFVYLLPEVMENNNDGKFSVPDTLLPAMRQNGDVIYSYDLEKAVPVHPGEGIFRLPGGDDRQHFYLRDSVCGDCAGPAAVLLHDLPAGRDRPSLPGDGHEGRGLSESAQETERAAAVFGHKRRADRHHEPAGRHGPDSVLCAGPCGPEGLHADCGPRPPEADQRPLRARGRGLRHKEVCGHPSLYSGS